MINTTFQKALLIFSLATVSPFFAQDIDWEKSFGGKHSDYLFDVQPTPDYGFILAGSSLSKATGTKTDNGQGNLDYWIWKMNEKGEEEWQKSFGGEGADLLQGIRLTKDGGFILAGTSESGKGDIKKDSCRGNEDYWVIKLNAKGGEEWQRTIGGSGQEQLQCVIPTKDGGFLIGGSSSSMMSPLIRKGEKDAFGKSENSYGNLDYWVVKLDAKGAVLWQRTLGGIYADQLYSVVETADGGFLLGGTSNSPISGSKTAPHYGMGDYYIIKLSENGQTEWENTFGGEDDDQLATVLASKDGHFYLAGYSGSSSTGNKMIGNRNGSDFWIIKIDESGEAIWQKTYDTGAIDILTSLVENDDLTLLLAGYSQGKPTPAMATGKKAKKEDEGINDYVVFKIKPDGEEIWSKSIGSSGTDVLRKAIETRDGGYLLAGTSNSEVKPKGGNRDRMSKVQGRDDFWVVKLKDNEKKKEKRAPLEAFPNPTQRFTNVIVGHEYTKGTAFVFDLAGRQLQSFPIKDQTIPVDLGASPEGIYIIEIRTDVDENAVKIVKTLNKN